MIILGGDYEHTLGMGMAESSCGPVTYQAGGLGKVYDLILGRGEFDVSEFSLSNHIMYRDRGDDWLTAIPVFPSRVFRHSLFVVPKESKLTTIAQLKGARLGIADYSQTAAVWARGIMLDHYGVDWRDNQWVSGANQRFLAPNGVKISYTPEDLEDLLLRGEIDALLATYPKDAERPRAERRLRYLFADVERVEREYFEQTGLFPIMHTVVIHHKTVARWSDAPKVAFDAYSDAKRRALQRRLGMTFAPWSNRRWPAVMELFGGDSHPYGLTPINIRNVETLGRYMLDQGLIERPVDVASIFAAGSADWL